LWATGERICEGKKDFCSDGGGGGKRGSFPTREDLLRALLSPEFLQRWGSFAGGKESEKQKRRRIKEKKGKKKKRGPANPQEIPQEEKKEREGEGRRGRFYPQALEPRLVSVAKKKNERPLVEKGEGKKITQVTLETRRKAESDFAPPIT